MIDKKLFDPLTMAHTDLSLKDEEPQSFVWTESIHTDPLLWAVAKDYDVVSGQMQVSGVGARRTYDPLGEQLEDTELFNSFTKLRGADRRPSSDKANKDFEDRIERWVNKYGLLHRKDYDTPSPFLREQRNTEDKWDWDAERFVNQAPINLNDFKEEVRQARSAADLYKRLCGKDFVGLAKWRDTLHKAEKRDGDLDELERHVLKILRPRGETVSNNSVALLATRFDNFLSQKLSNVQVVMSTSWHFTTSEKYAPRRKYRYPDLLTAIWLQFYLAITQGNEVRICRNPNCRSPFFPKRANQKSCGSGCRSSSRPSRKK